MRVFSAELFSKRHYLRGENNLPAIGHGVTRVDGNIEKSILDLGGVASHRR